MKYNEKIVSRICELLSTGEHSIKSTCKQVGISMETFFQWKKTKPEFSDSLKAIEEERINNIGEMALSGLAALVSGREYEEVTEEYEIKTVKGKQVEVLKSRRKVKKFAMPNGTSTIFTVVNRFPEKFRHIYNIDHTTQGKEINIPAISWVKNEPGADVEGN